jgi:ankyrin repeat protein
MLASVEGRLGVVTALAAAGADVNAAMQVTHKVALLKFQCKLTRRLARYSLQTGGTALMWASCNGHLEVVKALIAACADVNAATKVMTILPLVLADGVTSAWASCLLVMQ